MKSKLGELMKEIKSHDQEITPEKVAHEFTKWKYKRLGIRVSYFKGGKRTQSREWRYFDRLSDLLNMWREKYFEINLYKYFDRHTK